MTLSDEQIERLIDDYWYYAIELKPGVMTPGKRFHNVALTRHLLARCKVDSLRCLDIGTMEALLPVLLKRRNAGPTVAVDVLNFASKVEAVKAAYNVDFQYFPNVASEEIVNFLTRKAKIDNFGKDDKTEFGFDLVILSGVLYHVFSPLHMLGAARTCLRPGGLMIVETAAYQNPKHVMHHAFDGQNYIYGWTNTWFISTPLLDYLLRFFKLEPLDCVYHAPRQKNYPEFIRVAAICRAIDDFPALPIEDQMPLEARNLDYNAIVDYSLADTGEREPLPYPGPSYPSVAVRPETGTVDLYATVNNSDPLPYGPENVELRQNSTT